MRIAMLSPVAWRTPPRHYGPWESVASLITEGLVKKGLDVTLYATADSRTNARLESVVPRGYEEDRELIPKVWECLHIAELFESADQYDIIHNHFDFLPLTYSGMTRTPLVSTIHGFSSPGILPVYRKYNDRTWYVSISNSDRSEELDYISTVYHGIDIGQFTFRPNPEGYLLFFGRIHPDKGVREAIEIARRADKKLILAGIIQDPEYYQTYVEPSLDEEHVQYIGSVGPEDRDRLVGGADALLHPIRFDEPFGLSVIEAMACGTPVIAFNRGSMPELIRHRKNGFLVRNVDEAVEAVHQLDIIHRRHCRRFVESGFTVERMTENYIETYQRVLEEQKLRKRKSVLVADKLVAGKREVEENRTMDSDSRDGISSAEINSEASSETTSDKESTIMERQKERQNGGGFDNR